jgi:NAD(P)H-dependent flavin oxidoreductase YrpB (nitropropane dioxygenase family)
MAGAMDTELAIAVANAGGLGVLPAGMLNAEQLRTQVAQFRDATANKPINLNFFAHRSPFPIMRASMHGGKNSSPTISNWASIPLRRCLRQTECRSIPQCVLSLKSSSPRW